MTSRENRIATLAVPRNQRIGQAIVNSLKMSGHLQQESGKHGEVIYRVTGTDLFYIDDLRLKSIILAASSVGHNG